MVMTTSSCTWSGRHHAQRGRERCSCSSSGCSSREQQWRLCQPDCLAGSGLVCVRGTAQMGWCCTNRWAGCLLVCVCQSVNLPQSVQAVGSHLWCLWVVSRWACFLSQGFEGCGNLSWRFWQCVCVCNSTLASHRRPLTAGCHKGGRGGKKVQCKQTVGVMLPCKSALGLDQQSKRQRGSRQPVTSKRQHLRNRCGGAACVRGCIPTNMRVLIWQLGAEGPQQVASSLTPLLPLHPSCTATARGAQTAQDCSTPTSLPPLLPLGAAIASTLQEQ